MRSLERGKDIMGQKRFEQRGTKIIRIIRTEKKKKQEKKKKKKKKTCTAPDLFCMEKCSRRRETIIRHDNLNIPDNEKH